MQVITYKIKRQTVRINVARTTWDLDRFIDFIEANPVLGFDTETTGLDWWNSDCGFRVRLVQFGNGIESWVLPVEVNPEFIAATIWALRKARWLVAHNGTFDRHVCERTLGVPLEELAPRMFDTKILAHLVDPRQVKEGGPGLKLEELIKFYVDPVAADEVKGSMTQIAKRYKVKKADIWPVVRTFDEEYLLYAGTDPIWAYRLLHILLPKVPARSKAKGLIGWEHRLAHVMAKTERTGYLVDEAYAEMRIAELKAEEAKWVEVARSFGIENVNSNAQLIDAFQRFGFKLTKRTKKGNFAMDAEVLDSIDHPLAEAVKKATKAQKWRTTWFENALNGRDPEGRVHASVNPLQARTARMSITGSVPAQTFPAGTSYVRNMFVAEEGHVSVSIDFGNMELRFLAAESRDPVMMDAFLNDKDLHQITADAAGVDRKTGKQANFLTVFGGGWKALMTNAGVTEQVARRTIKAFNDTYQWVGKLSKKLMAEARRYGYIYTVTGRRLPVDRDRAYAALNYYIQSGSRDITARAVLNLDAAGFTPWIRLVIHDEIVFSFPKERAKELTERAARIMEFTVKGVLIPAEGEIGDRSWGSILDLEDSKH
ncbi:DNA polymerase [Streptomyces sp. SID8381]|uniref:DNA polymerase n=1 Tax=unclassified Streptomyces TaxID=2593676 RepID=UPI000361DB09|nr:MULTISPECIES: DNA polymerase [unclassified Streptomyces]MYX26021.1 DNA polymerase [Streptomyces sp. SID8381]